MWEKRSQDMSIYIRYVAWSTITIGRPIIKNSNRSSNVWVDLY